MDEKKNQACDLDNHRKEWRILICSLSRDLMHPITEIRGLPSNWAFDVISAGNKGQLDLMLHFHGTLIPFDGSLLLSSGLEVVLVELRTILVYSVFVHEPHTYSEQFRTRT